MNIAGLDLNLLLVFDTVMNERNITRAGFKIGMSQPAVSNALNRLRHTLKDDLFLRGADGMRPTARAIELATPIRSALMEIESALNPTAFHPATAERTFTLATTDYAALTWMPYIATYLSEEARGVNLHTIPIEGRLYEKLDTQEADFGFTALEAISIPDRFGSMALGQEEFICMMRPDHPLAKYEEIPLEEYAAARHLLVTPRGDARGFVDDALEKQGLKRRIVMTLNQFAAAPMAVLSSDMVLTAPSRIAEKCVQFFDIHIVKSPIQAPPEIGGMLIWHNRLSNHPAHSWFREQIVRACEEMEEFGVQHFRESLKGVDQLGT